MCLFGYEPKTFFYASQTMDMKNETFETWNKLASLYQEKFMDLDLYNESYDRFLKRLPLPGDSAVNVLEIACGPGNIAKYLLSKRPDLKVFGIDMAPNMIELAARNNPDADYTVMDCREIDQLESRFDAIICGFGIPYLSSLECQKMIADCTALLEDHGVIYLSFVEGDPECSGFITGSSGHRTFFNFHELNSLMDQLNSNGYKEIDVVKVDYKSKGTTEIHTVIIANK